MGKTLANIFTRVASHVNGEATAPTSGTDEYNLWNQFGDEAQEDWFDSFDFSVNRKEYITTLALSGTSVAINAGDFKGDLAGYTLVDGKLFEEIKPQEAHLYSGSKYVTVGGNDADGWYLNVYPAAASAASVSMPYWSRATSMATSAAVTRVPSPNYLTYSIASKVFLQREDARYTEFEAKANQVLQMMVYSDTVKDIQYDNSVKNETHLFGFILGED